MHSQRSARPDGAKIKNLREALGKTQKELLRSSPVHHRTYQRAEQGTAISRAVLSQIATLLRVPVADIMFKDSSRPEQRASVRLRSCDGRGAAKIVSELQTLWGKLEFEFQVDPYGEIATLIADVVRFCQMNHADTLGKFLAEPEYIEAAGELNTRIAELYQHGVNIYSASYLYWDSEASKDDDGKSIFLPQLCERMTIVFHDGPETLTEITVRELEQRDAVYRRCHARNYAAGLTPDYLVLLTHEAAATGTISNYPTAYAEYCKSRVRPAATKAVFEKV
jgi:transcriptional regulator with XRE-family HTH domain